MNTGQDSSNGADRKCRLCKTFEETTEHVESECPIIVEREYIERQEIMRSFTFLSMSTV